jgi:5'-nucleotidase
MQNNKKQILLTNDDGIQSPGLWAAAEALSEVGYVWVIAPRDQNSGLGRSHPNTSDGTIQTEKLMVHGKEWTTYSVGGTPAQAVVYGIHEIMKIQPDLVVSGINYGENLGTGITISGTVGAALEGSSFGIPSLAVSLKMDTSLNFSYSREIDFCPAGYFTALFARMLVEKQMPADVDVLKVEIPEGATIETPWRVTKVARNRYFIPIPPKRDSWSEPSAIDYTPNIAGETIDPSSDIQAVLIDHVVSVTPLSLDMTSRVDLPQLENLLRK